MATIAVLSAEVEARTEKFDRAMQAVERKAERTQGVLGKFGGLSKVFEKLARSPAELLAGLGGLAAVAELAIGAFKKLAEVAARAFRAAAQAIGVAIHAASDLNEQLNLERLVFKELTPEMRAWAKTVGDATGRSVNEVAQLATEFQAVVGPMVGARQEAMKFSKGLAQLAIDVSSARNISEGMALQKLRSGIVGESEAVRDLGADLRVAHLQQVAFSLGIRKSWKELTNAEQVLVRYTELMRATSDMHGDAANTAQEFANRERTLTSLIQSGIIPTLGRGFLPVGNEVLGLFVDLARKVEESSESMRTFIQDGIARLASHMTPVVTMGIELVGVFLKLSAFLPAVIKPMVAFAKTVLAVGLALGKVVPAIGTGIVSMLNDALSLLGGAVGGGLEEHMKKADEQMEKMRARWASILENLRDRVDDLGGAFGGMGEKIADSLEMVVRSAQGLGPALRGARDAAAGALAQNASGSVMNVAQNAAQGFAAGGPVGALAGVFAGLLSESEAFAELLSFVNDNLGSMANFIGDLLRPLIPLQAILSKLVSVVTMANPAFIVLGAVLDALTPVFKLLFNAVRGIAIGILKVAKWIADRFGGNKGINQALKDLEQTTYDNITATEEMTKAAQSAAGALYNIPQGFKIALERFRATNPNDRDPFAPPGGGDPNAPGPVDTPSSNDPIGTSTGAATSGGTMVFHITGANVSEIAKQVMHELGRLGLVQSGSPLGPTLPYITITGKG